MDGLKSRPARAIAALWLALSVGAVGLCLAAPPSGGGSNLTQFASTDGGEQADQLADNVFLWAERSTLQRLSNARELLDSGRYGEAVRYLGAILESPEDYFVQSPGRQQIYHSLKAEANALIGGMSGKGRESYELQYGAQSRRALNQAVQSGNPLELAEVSRQFFHTEAGYQATLLLGLNDLDHGRPLAAALTLKRLRDCCPSADRFEPVLSLAVATGWYQAGMLEKARLALADLKQRRGTKGIVVGQREVPLYGDKTDPVTWLAQWVGPPRQAPSTKDDNWQMFGGNPAHNLSTAASAPLLNMRWRVPITDDPLVEGYLRQIRQAYHEQGASDAPCLHPLAVDNVVLLRTLRNLLAVDFLSGKRLWEEPVDDQLETLLAGSGDGGIQQMPQLQVGLGQRIWDDLTYGTLSSDGRYVFSIEDLAFGAGLPLSRHVIINGQRQTDPSEAKPYNRLTAHDIHTGKLKWHIGGAPDQFALRQADVFFLGPPLPLSGRLYVLGETKGEIRLLALDADNGDLLWSQQMAIVEQNVFSDPFRRLSGVTPSYADGILVCPTSAGALVAVELTTRSLLWGYRYNRSQEAIQNASNLAMRMAMMRSNEPSEHWADSGATVVDGKVLISPLESEEILCLNLVDGKLLWKQPRQEDLYLACVDQGRLVLVGHQQLRFLNLSNGEPALEGRTVALPEGTVPSGRGFLGGHTYYLPLSSGEVVAVDLSQGSIVHVSKPREGDIPGNLICYKGRVISQGTEAVESFYQLDALRDEVARRLAANANDAEALSLRGELLSDEGKRDEAIISFRRSYELAHDPRTRELLRDALLEGLRKEFTAHRDRAAEIERLLENPQERGTFLRLMAYGLQQSGHWEESLDNYQKLIELDLKYRRLEPISRAGEVRRDRWVQSQLGQMRRANPRAAAAVDRVVTERLKEAQETGSMEALRRFLEYFGSQPGAERARQILIRRSVDAGRYLDAELLLRQKQARDDRLRSGAAVAEMAALLREAKRPEIAAVLYRRLATEFAGVVCGDGKTGRQLVDALGADDVVAQQVNREDPWPTGRVTSAHGPVDHGSMPNFGRMTVDFRDGRAPFFSETTIQYDQNRDLLLAHDGYGKVRWSLRLGERRQRFFGVNRELTFASACGNFLVLGVDSKLLAIDALGLANAASPRVLWTQDLADAGMTASRPRRIANVPIPNFGMNQFVIPRGIGMLPTTLRPVTEDYLCVQRWRDCMALNPGDGQTLWVRHEVPPGSTIFGDRQFVFIVPPDGNEAMVLNALDGSLVDRRKIPPVEQWLVTERHEPVFLGRDLLLRTNRADEIEIVRFDPWLGRNVWKPQSFDVHSKWCMVGDEAVAVLEPKGRFVMLDVRDGRVCVDAKVEPEPALADIYAMAMGDQYILVTNRQPNARNDQDSIQPLPGASHKPVANGLVYGFDRKGKMLWPAPVKVENTHLVVDQPDRLPIVTFACMAYHRRGATGGYTCPILCIDKRTGHVVYRQRIPATPSALDISGDAEKHTVQLRMQTAITLTFTDKPWTAEDKAAAEADDASGFWSKLMQAIMDSSRAGGKEARPK
jgi:outer membrane protein assembly factor BamB